MGIQGETSPHKLVDTIEEISQGFPQISQVSNPGGALILDKEIVKSALKDLKDNYTLIEREIEETTKK